MIAIATRHQQQDCFPFWCSPQGCTVLAVDSIYRLPCLLMSCSTVSIWRRGVTVRRAPTGNTREPRSAATNPSSRENVKRDDVDIPNNQSMTRTKVQCSQSAVLHHQGTRFLSSPFLPPLPPIPRASLSSNT